MSVREVDGRQRKGRKGHESPWPGRKEWRYGTSGRPAAPGDATAYDKYASGLPGTTVHPTCTHTLHSFRPLHTEIVPSARAGSKFRYL